jgi:hypothetical protein
MASWVVGHFAVWHSNRISWAVPLVSSRGQPLGFVAEQLEKWVPELNSFESTLEATRLFASA